MAAGLPTDDRHQRTVTERWRRFLLDAGEGTSEIRETAELDPTGGASIDDASTAELRAPSLTPDRDLPGAISLFTLSPVRRAAQRLDERATGGAQWAAEAAGAVRRRLGQWGARFRPDDDRTRATIDRHIPADDEPPRQRGTDGA